MLDPMAPRMNGGGIKDSFKYLRGIYVERFQNVISEPTTGILRKPGYELLFASPNRVRVSPAARCLEKRM